MSKRVQVKLNRAGVRALLKSEQMAAVCRQYASRVVQRAGTGYEMQQRSYPSGTAMWCDRLPIRRGRTTWTTTPWKRRCGND